LSLALDNVETMAARSDPAASDPRLATTLRTAHEQLRSLDRLVTEFRTFARSPHIALAPLDAVAVCEAAAAAARQAHPDASVQVVAMDAPGPVLGDAEQLRRAVVNLLLNAAEAAPGRPIELRTGTGPGADHWWIAVRDQGGGLPEHVAARIGEPYLTTKEGGTGLGLAVVIQIAEAHAGRLRHRHLGSGGFEMRLELSTAPGEDAS
jgi:signal transduction histidine kinase